MVIFHNELLVSTEVIDESTEVIKKTDDFCTEMTSFCGYLGITYWSLVLTDPKISTYFLWIAETRWVCLKIVYPYTQWLMIIIPTKWL